MTRVSTVGRFSRSRAILFCFFVFFFPFFPASLPNDETIDSQVVEFQFRFFSNRSHWLSFYRVFFTEFSSFYRVFFLLPSYLPNFLPFTEFSFVYRVFYQIFFLLPSFLSFTEFFYRVFILLPSFLPLTEFFY